MNLKRFIPLILLIIGYLILMISIYKQYGISWDEDEVYAGAKYLYSYLFVKKSNPQYATILLSDDDGANVYPYYGNAYGLLLYTFNRVESYDNYHLLNSVFFIALIITSYGLLLHKYKSSLLALLGPTSILLLPRFFGYIIIGPKDMSFAILFFMSLAAIYSFKLQKNLPIRVLFLGLIFGFTQSARIVGFTLYPIWFLYSFYLNFVISKKKMSWKEIRMFIKDSALEGVLVFIVASLVMIITWPYIGVNYLKHMIKIMLISKSFPWEGSFLFKGKLLAPADFPRLYIPFLITITTPLFTLFYFLLSPFFIKKSLKNSLYVLLVIALFFNLLLYIILKPVAVFRHYLFVLPVIGLISAMSFIEWLKYRPVNLIKEVIFIVTIVSLVITFSHFITLYPYQLVYYNEITGGTKGAEGIYDLKTHSIADKESIEWIHNNTNQFKKIMIYTCTNEVSATSYFSKNMILVNKIKEAEYIICPESNKVIDQYFILLHSIKREDSTVNQIFKLK